MKKDDKDDSFCTEDTNTYDETLNTLSYDENGNPIDPLTRLFESYHEQRRKVTFLLCNDHEDEPVGYSPSSTSKSNVISHKVDKDSGGLLNSSLKRSSSKNKVKSTGKKGTKLAAWIPFRKKMLKREKASSTVDEVTNNTDTKSKKKNKYASSEEQNVLELLETTSLLSMMSEHQDEEEETILRYNDIHNNTFQRSSMRKNEPSVKVEDGCEYFLKIDDELNDILQEGELYAAKFEYSKAISTYLKASDLIKKKCHECNLEEQSNYTKYDQHPVHGCIVKRLNDIHHAISLIRLSTQVLKMGLEEENVHDSNLKALKYYSVAYRMRRSLLGESHISLANILFMIARVQAKRQDYTESLLIYKLCLNLLKRHKKERKRGRNDSVGGSSIVSKGVNYKLPSICLQPHGDHASERKLFFDPPALQVLLRDIGAVYEKQRDYDKALEYYNESLHVQFGSAKKFQQIPTSGSSVNTAGSVLNELLFDNTSICYNKNQDKLQTEEEQQSMEIFVKGSTYPNMFNYAIKKDDVDSAMTLHSIGQIHRRLKQYNLALQAYNRALYCVKRTMGDKHPNVAAMLANIGNLYKEKGDMDMAFRIYQKVLRIEMGALGPNHPELAMTLNNISAIECSRGKYKEALGLLNRVYKIQKIVPSTKFKKSSNNNNTTTTSTNPSIAITLTSIGDVHEKLGDVTSAISSFEDAVRIYIQYFQNAESIEIGKLLHKIAILHHEKLNDLPKAESFMIRAVEVFQRIHKHQSSIQKQQQKQDENQNEYCSGDEEDEEEDDVPPCDADVALGLLKKAMNYYADIKAAIAVSRSDAWSVSSSESIGYSSV